MVDFFYNDTFTVDNNHAVLTEYLGIHVFIDSVYRLIDEL